MKSRITFEYASPGRGFQKSSVHGVVAGLMRVKRVDLSSGAVVEEEGEESHEGGKKGKDVISSSSSSSSSSSLSNEQQKGSLILSRALEVAAGGRLFHVVVDTPETGKALLQRGKLR